MNSRRYFFKQLASGLVAAAAPGLFLPKLIKPGWKPAYLSREEVSAKIKPATDKLLKAIDEAEARGRFEIWDGKRWRGLLESRGALRDIAFRKLKRPDGHVPEVSAYFDQRIRGFVCMRYCLGGIVWVRRNAR